MRARIGVVAGLCCCFGAGSAAAAPAPELPPDAGIVSTVENLAPGEATRLPEFTVIGDGLDVWEAFATRGPGIRDFCDKWVWAEDRERALYAGANHGVPHKFNDVWEYDLPSNTWVMLHAPDEGIEPSHTWWGLTYDASRHVLVWMEPSGGISNWGSGGYEGPPMRTYDTEAQTGWGLIMTDPPYINVSLAAALEYIPSRDVYMFHSNQWNGSGLQEYDPNTNAWTELIPQEELYFDNPDAPPAEALITYNSEQDVLVGFLDRSIYVYAFDTNTWTRVLDDAVPEGVRVSDSQAGTDYDPDADLHYVLAGGSLFAYDVTTNSMTDVEAEAPPEFGMIFYDRTFGVVVAYDETSAHWIYRHADLPPGGDDSDGAETGPGEEGSTSEPAESGEPPAETSTDEETAGTTAPPITGTDGSEDSTAAEDDSDASGCACRSTSSRTPVGLFLLLLLCARRGRRLL